MVKLKEFPHYEYLQQLAGLATERAVAVYLVGGGLRDLLLGRTVSDIDFALGGSLEELPRAFARLCRGSFFWLDQVRRQSRVVLKRGADSLTFDFAPLAGSVAEDLALRDFTINAMAVGLNDGEYLLDPLEGAADLGRRIIRQCAETAFTDDPLRLLRAFRFAATLGFSIEPSTLESIRRNSHLLAGVAAERIRDELFRIIAAPGAADSLGNLQAAGLLPEVFPVAEVSIDRVRQAEEFLSGLDRVFKGQADLLRSYLDEEPEAGISRNSLLKFAAFLGNRDGASVAAAMAKRLRLAGRTTRCLVQLLGDLRVPRAAMGENPTKRSMYRFFRDREAGPELMVAAMSSGSFPETPAVRVIDFFFNQYDSVRGELLTGDEIMQIFGIAQGRRLGEVINSLHEAERAGIIDNRDDALAFLERKLLTKSAS